MTQHQHRLPTLLWAQQTLVKNCGSFAVKQYLFSIFFPETPSVTNFVNLLKMLVDLDEISNYSDLGLRAPHNLGLNILDVNDTSTNVSFVLISCPRQSSLSRIGSRLLGYKNEAMGGQCELAVKQSLGRAAASGAPELSHPAIVVVAIVIVVVEGPRCPLPPTTHP